MLPALLSGVELGLSLQVTGPKYKVTKVKVPRGM